MYLKVTKPTAMSYYNFTDILKEVSWLFLRPITFIGGHFSMVPRNIQNYFNFLVNWNTRYFESRCTTLQVDFQDISSFSTYYKNADIYSKTLSKIFLVR